jgi:CubicO group peptidase (beta-lactamase class C family)
MKKPSRIIIIAVGLLGLVALTGIWNAKRLIRVYQVMTLFESDKIVENFRTMGEMFDCRAVYHGEEDFSFKRNLRDLPEIYEFKGGSKNIEGYLKQTNTTGLLVLRDDTLLFENYYNGNGPESKAISWSVAKSILSALIGMAIEDGYIDDIYDPVTKYAPFLKDSGYNDVPIKHVLQMSSGIRFNEDYGDFHSDINRLGRSFALNRPLDDFVLSLEHEKDPGTYNYYKSVDTQVLGIVLREALKGTNGKTISEYTEEKLWKPLGMESDACWLVDNDGMEAVFAGFNAVLRDYARFGRLYLKRGNWNGTQIVLEKWVQDSITPDAPHLLPGDNPSSNWVLGYGYQWWIPENPDGDFLAIGVYGQFIYIYPKFDIVIVKTSAYEDYNIDGDDMERETIEMFRSIARAMSP